MESDGITPVVEPCPLVFYPVSTSKEPKSELPDPSELMQLVKENMDQTRLGNSKQINHTQGSNTDSSEFEVHAMGDSSDNGSSIEEENREFKEFDPEKYGIILKSSIEEPLKIEPNYSLITESILSLQRNPNS